jgi:hypothetical protein
MTRADSTAAAVSHGCAGGLQPDRRRPRRGGLQSKPREGGQASRRDRNAVQARQPAGSPPAPRLSARAPLSARHGGTK